MLSCNAGLESRDKRRPGADKVSLCSSSIAIDFRLIPCFPLTLVRSPCFRLPLTYQPRSGSGLSRIVNLEAGLEAVPCSPDPPSHGVPSWLAQSHLSKLTTYCLCPFPPSVQSRGVEVDCVSSTLPACIPPLMLSLGSSHLFERASIMTARMIS